MVKNEELIDFAIKARENAYVPYSKFKVGAALLTVDDCVYTGCNIENSSYPVTICAERVAFSKAISEGKKNFKRIVIVGGENELIECSPCGMCRQFMSEFCSCDFEIILAVSKNEYKTYKMEELLPLSFNLGK